MGGCPIAFEVTAVRPAVPRHGRHPLSAYVDGMLCIALAGDRPLADLRPELSAGLDGLVLLDA